MKRKTARLTLWIITILGVVGFCLALESYREFGRSMMGEKTWCSFGELSSCQKAFESDYSVMFGRPISLYGAVAYFLVAAIAGLGLFNGGPYLLASLFHLALMSVALIGATGYFAWALFFQVKTLCVLCLSDYAVNLSIAALTFRACWKVRPPFQSLVRWDFRSMFGSRKGFTQTVVMLVLIGILGGVVIHVEHWYYFFSRDFDKVLSNKIARVDTPWARTFPTVGPEDAPIQVISFGDYECPFCDVMKITWNEIMNEYPGLIRMTAVLHPLNRDCNFLAVDNTSHAFACRAAYLALEVLEKKGDKAFWSIHDELYRNGQNLSNELLTEMGTRYGLTPEELEAVWAKSTARDGLKKHLQIADVLAFPGLPNNVVNGIQVQGYVEKWALMKMLKAEIDRKGLKLRDFKR